MDKKPAGKLTWAFWIFIAALILVNAFLYLQESTALADPSPIRLADEVLWISALSAFAVVGALILTRQKRNTIGLLMVVFPIFFTLSGLLDLVVRDSVVGSASLTLGQFLYVWFQSWSWWLLVGPILLIFFLYPTGHLFSARWRWAVGLLFVTFLLFVLGVLLSQTAELTSSTDMLVGTWPNPIGILPADLEEIITGVISLMLITSVLLAVVSVFVRYRRSQAVERAQIRWLFFACTIFFIVYAIAFIFNGWGSSSEELTSQDWYTLLFDVSVLAIPLAIGFSILRYRLWDIDVVINRSLVYAVLTTLLAGIFTGTAALLTQVAKAVFESDMQQAVAAVAAIFVASIFQPLRTWVENGINRRLFPENIDLSQGLIEINPDLWYWIPLPKMLTATLEHLQSIYNFEAAAIYLGQGTELKLAAAIGNSQGTPETYQLNTGDVTVLELKKGIVDEDEKLFVATVPIYLARRKAPDTLGVLRLGKRRNGRGYSGDDLKTLVAFGSRLGRPVYALTPK